MKKYNENENRCAATGQHITIFLDGEIVSGGSMEISAVCIRR